MISTAVSESSRPEANKIDTKLTNHTHAATFATRRLLSKRCAKLFSEKTCCKNELRTTFVMHRLTHHHPTNSLQEICIKNNLKYTHKHMVSTAVRESSGAKSHKVGKHILPTTHIPPRSHRAADYPHAVKC